MKTNLRTILLSAFMLIACIAIAQPNNLVVFSQDGYKFTLIVNGLRQNEKPETNVKVTGLTASNYKVRVLFEDANLVPIDQNVYLMDGGTEVHGKEFSYSIQNSKKGLKLKPNSVADITSTTASDQVVYQFNPSGNATQTGGYSQTTTTTTTGSSTTTTGGTTGGVVVVNTAPASTGTTTTVTDGGAATTTTTTTTTTGTATGAAVGVGVDGVAVGININIVDNMGGVATTSTTTTTTTSSSSTTTTGGTTTTTAPAPVVEEGCVYAMSSSDFAAAKKSISGQSFEDGKLKVAKQVLNSNCMSCAQVKEIMGLFSFEETKLDWAKFAYGKTTDPKNYYQLNDGFTFSTSVDDLNEYIESHKR
jgi:hypothetical protein